MKTKEQLRKEFSEDYFNYNICSVNEMSDWWLSQIKEILDEIVGEDKENKVFPFDVEYISGYNSAKDEIQNRITKLGL